LSNARAFLRLSCGACLLGLLGCAQGVPSPGTEGLDATSGDGGSSGTLSASGSFGVSGTFGAAGTVSQGGTVGVSGSGSGSAGAGAGAGHSGSGGSSTAGGTGASGGTGSGGVAAGGTAGTGASVGGGTGTLGCTHLQPGGTLGVQVQYKAEDAAASVPYVYFDIEIDNLDDAAVALADLHFRYYFSNDLTNPATEFYAPQIKHLNGNTENLGANDLTATYTPTYVEVSFTSTLSLMKGENVSFKVHMHSDPSGTHSQASDYSFSAGGSLMPSCKEILYQQTALAWGTPPG
jgi:cellulose binding protein with CBM3 domain